MTSTSLASTNLWIQNPASAHRQWRDGLVLAERAYAEQTQRVYNSLFGRFCAWLATQQCDLITMDQVDLARFLDTLKGRSGAASNRTQRTYVAEIDRVFSHLQSLGLRSDNPARHLLGMLRITTPLQPRSIKIPNTSTRANYLASLGKLDFARMEPEEVQSIAMNMLMLDCGLTLKEVQKLTLKHIAGLDRGELTAPGHRMLQPRTLKISDEALQWIRRWMEIRQDLNVITQVQYKALQSASKLGMTLTPAPGVRKARGNVFVSFTGKSGRPLGLRGSGLVLDRLPDSTVFLSAQKVILAGKSLSDVERKAMTQKGPQALRNLCCATLVGRGMPTSDVAAFLGLQRNEQVWAMERALKSL